MGQGGQEGAAGNSSLHMLEVVFGEWCVATTYTRCLVRGVPVKGFPFSYRLESVLNEIDVSGELVAFLLVFTFLKCFNWSKVLERCKK